MIYVIVILLIGAGALVYGIRDQKEHFGEQHFGEAEVVGHQPVRSGNLTMFAVNRVTGMVNPLVRLNLPAGMEKVVPLHTQVSRALFHKFPELDLGGSVSVTYYGDNPREAFLLNHPLGQKPVKLSGAILVGIGCLLCGIGLLIVFITTS